MKRNLSFITGVILLSLILLGPAHTDAQGGKATPTHRATGAATTAATGVATAAASAYDGTTPLDWPVAMPSKDQIEEARACDLKGLPAERYPANLTSAQLEDAFKPETPCDWAVLAVAYTSRLKERAAVPEEGKRAFRLAVAGNAALAF